MFSANKIRPVSVVLVVTVSVILMLTAYAYVKPSKPPSELRGVLRPSYRLLQPFELVDQYNTQLNEHALAGKWSIVFFGYLSCPDICPTTLHVLNTVHSSLEDEIGAAGRDLQVIFVSVDPNRDSIENIAEYVKFFNSEFIGATGKKTELDKLVHQFSAGYLIEEEFAPGQYNVAHTSALFLVDPQSRLVASFSQPHYPETIGTQYRKIVEYIKNG